MKPVVVQLSSPLLTVLCTARYNYRVQLLLKESIPFSFATACRLGNTFLPFGILLFVLAVSFDEQSVVSQ
jgi:hypothetical protein